jgi:hypothetical protein
MAIIKQDLKVALQEARSKDFDAFLKTRPRTKRDDSEKLPLGRFCQEGIARQQFTATVPSDTPYERLFTKQFWQAVASKIRIGDEITVRPDDLRWWAKLICVSADQARDFVEMQELYRKDLAPASATLEQVEGFTTRYEGLSDRWVVYRAQDNHRMQAGFESRAAALDHIKGDLKPKAIG